MLTPKYDFFCLKKSNLMGHCMHKSPTDDIFLHVCCCIGEFGVPHVQGVFTINT